MAAVISSHTYVDVDSLPEEPRIDTLIDRDGTASVVLRFGGSSISLQGGIERIASVAGKLAAEAERAKSSHALRRRLFPRHVEHGAWDRRHEAAGSAR